MANYDGVFFCIKSFLSIVVVKLRDAKSSCHGLHVIQERDARIIHQPINGLP